MLRTCNKDCDSWMSLSRRRVIESGWLARLDYINNKSNQKKLFVARAQPTAAVNACMLAASLSLYLLGCHAYNLRTSSSKFVFMKLCALWFSLNCEPQKGHLLFIITLLVLYFDNFWPKWISHHLHVWYSLCDRKQRISVRFILSAKTASGINQSIIGQRSGDWSRDASPGTNFSVAVAYCCTRFFLIGLLQQCPVWTPC